MVTRQSVDQQLKKINFNTYGWGRTELRELPNVLLPDEEIYECVNGIYEGGFALLVATNIRVLLIDKKPLNYLTVEDLRFDMINEMDYSHRLLGARIAISTGYKDLKFTSYNQQRLRKLISHVQHCMAENKKKQSEHQEDQRLHLEQINQQLQTYLLAQHQQQERLQEQLHDDDQQSGSLIEPVRPSPQLSDYLFAQSLLAQHKAQAGQPLDGITPAARPAVTAPSQPRFAPTLQATPDDLYAEGVQEVFGKRAAAAAAQAQPVQPAQEHQPGPAADAGSSGVSPLIAPLQMTGSALQHALDINPLRIAYSKLPMAMRNRRFGRPSFHAHSQAEVDEESPAQSPARVASAHY
jgi:hypothetical protein